jgi:hypothetical protein
VGKIRVKFRIKELQITNEVSFSAEKQVRLEHYFDHFLTVKAPRVAARLKFSLDKKSILNIFNDFLNSEIFKQHIPQTLFSGSLKEKNLRYNFVSLWSLVQYFQTRKDLCPKLQNKLVTNSILDAFIFDSIWRKSKDIVSEFIDNNLGINPEWTILKLPAEPDWATDTLYDLQTPHGYSDAQIIIAIQNNVNSDEFEILDISEVYLTSIKNNDYKKLIAMGIWTTTSTRLQGESYV